FNLLSNAVKFTLEGDVSLIVSKLPQGIAFTVADTGIGIPSDKLSLVFEPFCQLDSGLNRKFSGTGLGLALTRSLAHLHGGDVTAESRLGEGSQFTLYLPDYPSSELHLPASPYVSGECEGQCCSREENGRILLVENDERTALVLKDYFRAIGYPVKHLTDSTEFFDAVRSFKPNLLLIGIHEFAFTTKDENLSVSVSPCPPVWASIFKTDAQLVGDCTGFDLLLALRRETDTKNLKVVMAIAGNGQGDYSMLRDRCLEAGADECISKPIGIAQLEAVLMRYL
ncbi:MAG: hypothetical protein LDL41_24310, partial [Coleofasciculus sp. S288]|nr:hypothetical protein [Coleofasciculus sp. S288]